MYQPSKECLDQARVASSDKLGEAELRAAFAHVDGIREKLINSGKQDRLRERLQDAVDKEVERTRIAAALERKRAALDAITRDKLTTVIGALQKRGYGYRKTILSLMEGSAWNRVSVMTQRQGYEARYVGGFLAEIARDRPYLFDHRVLADKKLDADVTREMGELREGGTPGVTKNDDAVYLAKKMATYQEMSRTEVNSRGGNVGKLDGYHGAQVHDDIKMIAAGKGPWVESVINKLDIARSFPDAESPAEVRDLLGNIFDTIITGVDRKPIVDRPGTGRVNPANLAKSLGKSRVLHFKNADEALAYRAEFGYGTTIGGFLKHQQRVASITAQMDMFGTNPENMLRTTMQRMAQDVASDPKLSEAQKAKMSKELKFQGGVEDAFNIMQGLHLIPVNAKAANVARNVRYMQSFSKLGGMLLSAMPPDTIGAAAAVMNRGGGFYHGLHEQIGGMIKGYPKGEQLEIMALNGEGFDGLIQAVMGEDGASAGTVHGFLSKKSEQFFRATGQTWWTDKARAVSSLITSREMGMRIKTNWADLPPRYSHVLELNGIDEGKWQAIQQASFRADNGHDYVTPDKMRDLPDDAIKHLVAGDLTKADQALQERLAARQAKTDLEGQWVEKRTMRLAGKMGREEARLEDTIAGMKGKADAQTVALKTKIGDLKGQLSELADFYGQGKGTERGVARQELTLQQRVAGAKKAAAKIQKGLAENLAGLDEGLNTRLAGHLDAIGKIENRLAGSEDVKATAAGSAKVADIQERIQKAMDDIEARRGKMEAGAQERADALHGRLDDLQTKLADVSGSYPIQKGQARAVGRDEGRIAAKEREVNRSIADINSGMEKAGKDKGASMMASWAKREGELKEFTDRMGRYGAARAEASAADVAGHTDRLAAIHDNARHDLEMDLHRFFADETNYAIIEPDARTTRTTTWGGLRPGTFGGEAARFIMQFKGFPTAFLQRVIGRQISGQSAGVSVANRAAHIGVLLAGMTAAGYMSNTMSDFVRGKSFRKTRDKADLINMIGQAIVRGGAAGLYGDFLLGQTNRFGNTMLETAAGPTLTSLAGLGNIYLAAKGHLIDEVANRSGGSAPLGQALNSVISNTPFASLFYVRPALDYLFLNSLREAASPGYLKRQEQSMQRSTGQSYMIPRTIGR